ncbi:hypothetical protein HK102_000543, partial [Quaeritorhiza haematococci]
MDKRFSAKVLDFLFKKKHQRFIEYSQTDSSGGSSVGTTSSGSATSESSDATLVAGDGANLKTSKSWRKNKKKDGKTDDMPGSPRSRT